VNEQLVHHYPPELFDLLVEGIPRLLKGKQSVLTFFKGCGVDPRMYDDLQQIIYRDRESITKFEIVRRVLTRLNDLGDSGLRARREILKRVTQWDDFTSCYDKDRAPAEGYVARIQRVVNVKDSFTRMRQAQERAQDEVRSKRDSEIAAVQQLKRDREQVRLDLVELCQETDASKRGKALEAVLNRLFALEGILIREAFKRLGVAGEGVVEQIDGVVALDGTTFLVEMKWWAKHLGVNEVSPHLVRVYSRSDVAGIIISSSGFTEPAVTQCREALAQKIVVLMTLAEIVRLLERSGSFVELLRKKIQAARLEKNPLLEVGA
jgi:restriction system protein